MSGRTTYNTREADRVESLCDGLSEAEENQVWDTYVDRGYDAAAAVATSHKARFKARFKAELPANALPPDVVADVLAAYQAAGDWAPIRAALQQLATPAPRQTKLTDSGRQSAMTKAQKTTKPTLKQLIETALTTWDGR